MNDYIPRDLLHWWAIVARQSWAYSDLIGQYSPLPIANGGTGTSTVGLLISTLGLSSMAYQESSNVAITGGSISTLAFLSTTATSTGTLRALTNVSSATVSTASVYATDVIVATRVSTATVSTASLYAPTLVSTTAISTNTLRAVTNVSSATVSTGTVYGGSVAITGQVSFSAVTTITNAHSPYTVLSTDRFIRCNASSGTITVLMPYASSVIRDIFVKKVDSSVSTITISSIGADTFDGKVTTALASQYAVKAFINGTSTNWDRLNVGTL